MKGRKCVTPRVTRSLNVLHTNPLCYAQFSKSENVAHSVISNNLNDIYHNSLL